MTKRYESETFQTIMNRALARIPDTLDKREGSLIYEALAPACYELAEAYQSMDEILVNTFPDTATGTYLDLRVAELGITRQPATKAVRLGLFNLAVPVGSRFSISGVNFVVSKVLTGFDRELQCETAGSIGNLYSGAMVPISYIAGLTTANLTTVLIAGEDEEDDETLRARYFSTLDSQPYGGNVADYKLKTKALTGVGGCKVFPVWNGGGTVKLVITGSDDLVPSGSVVTDIQTQIDPITNSGEGLGIAPIGHTVTVAGATALTINVGMSVTLAIGYLWADVEPFIEAAIEAYLADLRDQWDTEDQTIVRISQITSAILTVTGVTDVTGVTLNAGVVNLTLAATEIPILGTVTNS